MNTNKHESPKLLYCDWLFDGDSWQQNVLLKIISGKIRSVEHTESCPAEAEYHQIILPGMPNLHSHSFQRAFAGDTEKRTAGQDSFWSWRQQSYAFLQNLTADKLYQITLDLYKKMLSVGYTSVAEFHYLHHGAQGESPEQMSAAVISAAGDAGMALTLVPVLYQYSGFGRKEPTAEQGRFVLNQSKYLQLLTRLKEKYSSDSIRIGAGVHSLRAVDASDLPDLLAALDKIDANMPFHIHISEQVKEVEDCLAATGKRPLQLLFDSVKVTSRFCLIHATHPDESELEQLATSGAVVGLCPITEANLGDGIFPAQKFLAAGGAWGIGSDCNIEINPFAELKLLEYGQRLQTRQRLIFSSETSPHTGQNMLSQALSGGAQALGRKCGRIKAGYAADLLSFSCEQEFAEQAPESFCDRLVFSDRDLKLEQTIVAGRFR